MGEKGVEGGGYQLCALSCFEKITFTRPKEASASSKDGDSVMVQAIVFAVEDREIIGGSAYGGQRAVCCTPDLAKLGACTQGTVVYRPSTKNPDWPHVFSASFNGKDLVTLPSQTISVTRTGMYNLYFIYCDSVLDGLVIEGKTIWKNPTGYLPGRMAPLMNFYGFMSIAFVMLGIFWFSQYARFWREVLLLQNCITLVIALGMFEMALWYFEYAEFNKTGVRPMDLTFWAVTFSPIKRTVSRVIVLAVSMGFGVVKPTLGGLTCKVTMLGATFLLASEILELVENVGAVSDLFEKARLFLVLPVALLDAFFILWIFTSLSKTLDKLQLYFKSTDVYNEHWQSTWIIPAFWRVLFFSLLCVICALWAPSQNSMSFISSQLTYRMSTGRVPGSFRPFGTSEEDKLEVEEVAYVLKGTYHISKQKYIYFEDLGNCLQIEKEGHRMDPEWNYKKRKKYYPT